MLDRGLDVTEGDAFTVDIPDAGSFEASIVAKTDEHTHARLDLDDDAAERLASLVSSTT